MQKKTREKTRTNFNKMQILQIQPYYSTTIWFSTLAPRVSVWILARDVTSETPPLFCGGPDNPSSCSGMGYFAVWIAQFDALLTKNVASFKMRKGLFLCLTVLPLIGPFFYGPLNRAVLIAAYTSKGSGIARYDYVFSSV